MNEYSIEWMEPSVDDLAEIARYYKATAGSEAGSKVLNTILSKINELVEYPYANPYIRYETLREKGFRVLVIDNYLCFYKVAGKTVSIYRVLHSSRNYAKLFR
jgi:addiction module RelE/StbE family toxin